MSFLFSGPSLRRDGDCHSVFESENFQAGQSATKTIETKSFGLNILGSFVQTLATRA